MKKCEKEVKEYLFAENTHDKNRYR